jgi:retron-type reverse transcriptase
VTPDHQGQPTPGVAGIAARTPAARRTLAAPLQRDGHGAPGRRVDSPNPGTRAPRPWGRPTLAERTQPGLVTRALEPAGAARCESHREGVRPGRRTWDALDALSVQSTQTPTGVLAADRAQGCDRLDHDAR